LAESVAGDWPTPVIHCPDLAAHVTPVTEFLCGFGPRWTIFFLLWTLRHNDCGELETCALHPTLVLSGKQGDLVMLGPTFVVALSLLLGFVYGYGVRAAISKHRRRRAWRRLTPTPSDYALSQQADGQRRTRQPAPPLQPLQDGMKERIEQNDLAKQDGATRM
jgi:hypothetical protein